MKKIRFIAMLLAVTMMVIGTLSTASAAGLAETTSLVVKLINGLTATEQTAAINRNGGVETSSIPALRLHVVSVQTINLSSILGSYQVDPQVQSVELNKTRKTESIPSNSVYSTQWALSKIGWISVYGNVTPSGSAKIALLDTGVDASHPDLSSNIISGTSILNNYTTDGLSDTNGHGTSLAGIIAGVGYAGVQIMPVTVMNANGIGQDSDIIAGIIWAAENGANVILMGFSNPDFSTNLQDAIDYAWSKGAVMVAAAGNNGLSTPTFPAGNRGVIGVSATDQNDILSASSNFGQHIFLAAPGTDIYTTGLNNSYNYISGTSASSAIVAGVAAFMKAVNPDLTNGVIVGRLARSADAVGTVGDINNPVMFGNGRINMANTLANIGTDEVMPAGAAPVGNGGPFVGPYVAANIVMPIESISSSSQQSTLTLGTAVSTQYTITVVAGDGWFNIASLTVRGLPTGATASINQSLWDNLFIHTFSTAMTVTTSAATPAGSFPLIIGNTLNNVTGSATLVINNAPPASQVISVDIPAPGTSQYGSTFNVAAHSNSGLAVAITTSGSCSGSGSSTGVSSPVAITMNSGSGVCTVMYDQAGNSSFSPATQVTSVTNATTRPITITADAKTKTYGTADPALTFQTTGIVNGDNINVVLTRAPGENVGPYAITLGTTVANSNYDVTYVGANLTISKAAVTITADAKTKTYGTADPALTFQTTGLVNGDNINIVLTRAVGENVGPYAITAEEGFASNLRVSTAIPLFSM